MPRYGGYNTNSKPQDEYVKEVFEELGFERWGDIFVPNGSDNNPAHYRPGEYATPEEALLEYYERGLGYFTKIYYDPDCDCYQVYIDYPG